MVACQPPGQSKPPRRRRVTAMRMMARIEAQEALLEEFYRVLDLAVEDRNNLAAEAAAMAVELQERAA